MARIKVVEDFREFLRLCLQNELRFMVIGGYAVVHHSRPRYTGDMDVWVDSSWFAVRSSWFVVRSSWFAVRGSWFVAF